MIQQEMISGRAPLQRLVSPLVTIGMVSLLALFVTKFGDRDSGMLVWGCAAGIVYLLTLFDIRIGLVATMAAIGLAPEFVAGGVSDLRAEDFLIPVLLFAKITRKDEHRKTFLWGTILLYLTANLFSVIYGISFNNLNMTRSLFIFGKFVEYFVLLSLVINIVRTPEEIRFFTYTAVIIAILASFQGMFLGASSQHGLAEGRVGGPEGESPNLFAGYIAMHTALCIGLFLEARTARTRFLLAAGVVALFYTALFTYSRTGYTSLFIGLGVFGLIYKRQVLVITLLVAVLFPLIAPSQAITRAGSILSILDGAQPDSYKGRLDSAMWAEGYIWQSPLFGNGLGFLPLGWLDNEYMRVWVDVGTFGLAAFLCLLFRIGLHAIQAYRISTEGTFERGLFGGFLICFLCMLVHALGATSFTSIRTMETFMILTGLFLSQKMLLLTDTQPMGASSFSPATPREWTLVAIPENYRPISPPR